MRLRYITFRSVKCFELCKNQICYSHNYKEKKKFVSFTDWEFDGNVENAVAVAKGFWPEMKKHGAVNMRATVTGEKTIRTMTVWSSKNRLKRP